ncbi:tape measure protein [Flavobacterium muglaense]|uniref:Tape measure protein n=1 Tax=Flavobacterium muglaense TaxID=2764716 RepID=A0A923SGF5_9FLAO|nr:tape measure protein [Flavobacterium muglaense]MBC5839207.1 tape measure protein [Flavobacterium muglaense]MBC5845682.1 tape measure protein [Flavobacterium muglaense]
MNNTIQFTLRMQDLMSTTLSRVSSGSQSAFNRMSQSANQMTGRNRVLAMSFTELQNKIRQVEDTISRSTIPSQIASARRELALLQRQSNNHAGNVNNASSSSKGIGIGGVAVGSMLGGLAKQGATMVIGAVTSGIGEMVSRSMEKEQAITGLSTFLGKDGANEAYKNIRKDADVTPFNTTSLLEVNRSLISAGANAKDARTDTMNLANAVSAVGGGNDILSRMAANMQQIKTVGKATAMDIRQFGIAGINIYAMLAQSTGKSIAQVKEMDVTYDDLAKTLAMANAKGGIYEGAMTAQSQTEAGKWSTVKDLAKNTLSDIGDAFKPARMQLLDIGIKFASGVSSMLAQAQPYIDAFSSRISQGVDYILAIVNGTSEWSDWVSIAVNHFSVIWEFTKNIGVKLWGFVSSIVEFIKNSQILKDLFTGIGWIMEKAGNVILWVVDKVVWLWENVIKPILNVVDGFYKKITGRGFDIKATTTLLTSKGKPDSKPDNPRNSPLGAGGAMVATNTASGKTAGEAVTGAQPKVVNIHIGKFFDNIQFTTMNGKESAQELENIVMEALARVLYNGSKLV